MCSSKMNLISWFKINGSNSIKYKANLCINKFIIRLVVSIKLKILNNFALLFLYSQFP